MSIFYGIIIPIKMSEDVTIKMKIDFHIHAFPDEIAHRAIDSIGKRVDTFDGRVKIHPVTDGTITEAREHLVQYGVDAGVLLPIATRPGQQRNVNDWAARQNHGRVISFGSVHPRDPEALSELDRIVALGLKGIKLHPDYQDFFVDDPYLYPVYEKIEDLGLPIVFHAGQDPYSPAVIHGKPSAFAKIAKEFPRLQIVAAHMGGIGMYEESMEYIYTKNLPNLYVDTSMAHTYAEMSEIRLAIRMMGADHVLFASDMPWSSGQKAIANLENMGLKPDELEKIFYKNAMNLLQIPADRIGGE